MMWDKRPNLKALLKNALKDSRVRKGQWKRILASVLENIKTKSLGEVFKISYNSKGKGIAK